MPDNNTQRDSRSPEDTDAKDVDLSTGERQQVQSRAAVDSYVVHEVIRRQGHDELDRPAVSLFWSGLAAGFAISASILGKSLLSDALEGTPWQSVIGSFGYTIGFVIVILGRMQLFTESTLSATIPVATNPTLKNLLRLARLWSIVFCANILGTFVIAGLISADMIGYSGQTEGMLNLARGLLTHSPLETFYGAIPAGFLLAAVAWSLPVGRGQEFFVVLFFTYFVSLGDFAHVIAGSGEAWLLLFNGEAPLSFAVFGFILPALAGNMVGGTLIFSLLAHAQVSREIDEGE